MPTFYLVRHTSVNVVPGLCYGQAEVPLAPTFEQEAQVVARNLSAYTFDLVFSSPLQRCQMLANYCGYKPITDDRLLEINFGRWESRLWDSITEPWLDRWFEKWTTLPVPQGESFADVVNRSESFLRMAVASKASRILIFTHAGFIRALEVHLGIYSTENVFSQKIAYGQIIELDV